jgi:carbon monoxide dehydrogenase subunit G
MDLTHELTVPATLEATWEALADLGSVVAAFPGTTVTSAEDGTVAGSYEATLGTSAVVYAGSATLAESSESAARLVIEATGRDEQGNGSASARITVSLTDVEIGALVEVRTVLSLTGENTTLGDDVSQALLARINDCLVALLDEDQDGDEDGDEDGDGDGTPHRMHNVRRDGPPE